MWDDYGFTETEEPPEAIWEGLDPRVQQLLSQGVDPRLVSQHVGGYGQQYQQVGQQLSPQQIDRLQQPWTANIQQQQNPYAGPQVTPPQLREVQGFHDDRQAYLINQQNEREMRRYQAELSYAAPFHRQQQQAELHAWAKQQDYTMQDAMEQKKLERAVSAVMSDDHLLPEERDDLLLRLRTKIDPLAERQKRAMAQRQQEQTRQLMQQNSIMQSMANMDASARAKFVKEHTTPLPDGSMLYQGPDGKAMHIKREKQEASGISHQELLREVQAYKKDNRIEKTTGEGQTSVEIPSDEEAIAGVLKMHEAVNQHLGTNKSSVPTTAGEARQAGWKVWNLGGPMVAEGPDGQRVPVTMDSDKPQAPATQSAGRIVPAPKGKSEDRDEYLNRAIGIANHQAELAGMPSPTPHSEPDPKFKAVRDVVYRRLQDEFDQKHGGLPSTPESRAAWSNEISGLATIVRDQFGGNAPAPIKDRMNQLTGRLTGAKTQAWFQFKTIWWHRKLMNSKPSWQKRNADNRHSDNGRFDDAFRRRVGRSYPGCPAQVTGRPNTAQRRRT